MKNSKLYFRFFVFLLFVLHFSFSACAADVVIAERGKGSDFVIVVPSGVMPTEQYAADEMQAWTEKLTGVKLAIVSAVPSGKHAIRIMADDENLDLGEDGFNLRIAGDDIEIRGGLRGVIYGVYEILETYGGIGWFAPHCTVIPETGILKVPESLYDTQRPAFLLRETDWSRTLDPENQYAVIPENRDFGVRRRFNGEYSARANSNQGGIAARFVHRAGIAHTFLRLVPPATYFKDHPEYYSEINGVRRAGETQLCLTNPEVLEVLVSNLVTFIDKDPTAPFYGVSQDDWFNYCECANCRKVDAEEASHAGTLLRFVNAVAAKIDQVRPGRMCETLAYQYTRQAPKITRPASNVVVCLCNIECDWARPLAIGKPECNADFVRDLKGWYQITDRLFAWDYTSNFRWFAHPFPNLNALQANIRFFRDHGVKWIFEEGNGYDADFSALKCYLISKWLWNPDLPRAALVDTFFKGYYGAAAPFARAVMEDYEKALYEAPEGKRFLRVYENDRPTIYTDALLKRARELWRQAEEVVKDDPIRLRNVRLGRAFQMAHYLDRAAEKAKFAWVTRKSESFQTGEEIAADYAWISAWIQEQKRIRPRNSVYFAGRDTGRDVRVTNDWAKAVAVKRPEMPCDAAIIGVDDLAVEHAGTWAMRLDDPKAMQGRAILITTKQDIPAVNFSLSHLAFDEGVNYRIRVHLRVDKVPGGKGEAFYAEICDTGHILAPDVETLKGEYAWYDLATMALHETNLLRIGCGRFKKGGGQNAVKGIYVDAIAFERAK